MRISDWSSDVCSSDLFPSHDTSYYPDFVFEAKKETEVQTYIVEIKPKKQTLKPKPRKNKRAYLNECITYETNTCKWNAANDYCKKNGWIFKILTEEDIFKGQKSASKQ